MFSVFLLVGILFWEGWIGWWIRRWRWWWIICFWVWRWISCFKCFFRRGQLWRGHFLICNIQKWLSLNVRCFFSSWLSILILQLFGLLCLPKLMKGGSLLCLFSKFKIKKKLIVWFSLLEVLFYHSIWECLKYRLWG